MSERTQTDSMITGMAISGAISTPVLIFKNERKDAGSSIIIKIEMILELICHNMVIPITFHQPELTTSKAIK